MHLGDFDAAVKELDPGAEKDTFTFFGKKFEIIGQLPPMLVFQLGATMTGKVDETEGMAALWEAYQVTLGAEAFGKFYRLAVEKKADEQSLMELVMSIFEASGGERPTVQVPVSPVGQLPTSPSSSTSSTHPALVGLTPVSQALAG